MEIISGYRILEKIDETKRSIVYRGRQDKEDSTVIIKVLKTENLSPSDIARFKHEYELIKKLDLDGIIKTHDIVDYNGGIALVLEDFNGISLGRILKNEKISIKYFLQIAIKLSDILGNLHISNIIHKDIKPKNILINTKEEKVKITDFGISTVITHENEQIYNPDVIEGTLVYISPEQTGRINRTVDYRTDLYSLGITFYEMITGRPPYKSKDPLKMIHSHIARKPTSPFDLNTSIPGIISAIIMKLLSKTAEERYQNSFGLLADLKNCLEQLDTKGKIEEFEIAQNDISIRFNIPQKLFGREEETDILMSSFERVSNGTPELMLVSGRPGIGKSALINEIHKPIIAKKGYFISGKYEQLRRDVPYSAIIQAFQGLVRQILAESDDKISIWKENLLEDLGPNGKVITDVIPDIELIIGKQPDLPSLGPEESQNRFNIVFKNFINIFGTEEHPLVLFLDDLQWANLASLNLIKTLITDPDIKYLFLICAYRDNEIDRSHILTLAIEEIRKTNTAVNTITLPTLNITAVNQIISNFLRCDENTSMPLSEHIFSKTGGNPFFVNQFLKILHDENILNLDPLSGWEWDIEQIRSMQVTDNVINLLAGKISELESATRDVLKIAACIGNRFDLETLSMVSGKEFGSLLFDLSDALQKGYIYFDEDICRFLHDRIQEAAYSLIPDNEKSELHYKIGKLVLENTPEEDLKNKIFYIVDQLNHGIDILSTQEERDKLSELNLLAGKKANFSTAYLPALKHLNLGISLLREDSWQTQYDLTLSLYEEAVEAACLCGEFEEMGDLFDTALQEVNNVLDMVKFYEIKILAYTSQNNLQGAIEIGLSILKLLGVGFPQKPNKLQILLYLIRVKLSLRGRQIEDLLKLPEMTDPYKLSAMRIVTGLIAPAFETNPELLALLAFKNVYLSVKYGNTSFSATGYSIYGLLLCGVLGDINSGYKFGRLALDLLERLNHKKLKSQIIVVFNGFIRNWKEHVKETLPSLLDGYQIALDTGDLENGAYCLFLYDGFSYHAGKELTELELIIAKHAHAIRQMKQETALNYVEMTWQVVLNLIGKSRNPDRLIGEIYNEEKMIPIHLNEKDKFALAYLYGWKGILCYLFHNYHQALQSEKKVKKYLEVIRSSFAVVIFFFYYSLINLALYPDAGKLKQKLILITVASNQRKLKKWANYNLENCLNKFYLVKAERANVLGNYEKAVKHYDKAIYLSKENGLIQDEALANELAAKFYISRGWIKTAKMYMQNARYIYERWGATAKVKDLEEKYPEFITKATNKAESIDATNRETDATSTGNATEALDLSTVMKASQAISEEIVLSSLLEKMMMIVMENAGAEKGILILEDKGRHLIEARGDIESKDIALIESIPIDESDDISSAIVRYVERTMENLILNDATKEGAFTNDPYIVKNRTKSILCVPIINQSKLSAILYLENNLTTGAFTPERIEVLNILSSQVAISIDNARLYANLEDKVKERTRELHESNTKLQLAMDALWGEMALAKKIQTVLLPDNPVIKGYEFLGYMEPADEVGGDYYDVINGKDIDWVIIGDVSGHGVPAGLVMMMVQTSIQTIIRDNPDIKPSEILTIINRSISYNIKKMGEHKYMTITVLALHRDGKIIYSGLHQDILVYRAETCSVESIQTDGLWIGFDFDLGRNNIDFEFQLYKDDLMLLYTDGITESIDSDNKMFSYEKLVDILDKTGNLSPDEIKNSILDELKGYTCNDDVTMVVIKRIEHIIPCHC